MGKITNPILLALSDLRGSIISLKQPKIVEEAMLELVSRIKELYAYESDICKLCKPLYVYPHNLSAAEKEKYTRLLRERLLERNRVFAKATKGDYD